MVEWGGNGGYILSLAGCFMPLFSCYNTGSCSAGTAHEGPHLDSDPRHRLCSGSHSLAAS